ncbi:GGDEF domain-containing protein [Agaribacter marinus]|uniref:diguanylate cyclase n=1 Tax=Agaribacter marinus TaxID=1431249 RepID=A0AA37WJJ4_9ALTE|nr:GGDEF domain-containing protein [Agaribacter marinus]GLR69860.1 hypothetical protein GCM10007852_07680 [Agaribacter marinus]
MLREQRSLINLDAFPCLLLVTDLESNRIKSCNQYVETMLCTKHNEVLDKSISDFLSKATLILFESYIRPLILDSGECIEVQITLIKGLNEKLPAVANIILKDGCLHWSIFSATERDKLYQELIDSRDRLEQKTEELIVLTRLDPLTQLLNRRAANEDINDMLSKSRRKFIPLAFILIDIDHFKALNDKFGHAQGDDALKQVSDVLGQSCRDTDVVCRWGGEEFLIVLYDSNANNTVQFCDRLHKNMQNITVYQTNITISIGVSHLTSRDIKKKNMFEQIMKRADTALYEAKNKGRNRTEYSIN